MAYSTGGEASGAQRKPDWSAASPEEQEPHPLENIGVRIREVRTAKRLGVRELAKMVGCSPSAISQIEGGRANPSVSTLYAISSALGITTDSLFSATSEVQGGVEGPAPSVPARSEPEMSPDRESKIIQRRDGRRVLNLERGVRWELLTPTVEGEVEFMEVRYDVGGGSTFHDHAIRHAGREYSVILEGQLSVQIGFDEYVLGPGDSMSFDSTLPHRFWNSGDVPVRAIWCVLDRWSGV